jgi:hypothetical protein
MYCGITPPAIDLRRTLRGPHRYVAARTVIWTDEVS